MKRFIFVHISLFCWCRHSQSLNVFPVYANSGSSPSNATFEFRVKTKSDAINTTSDLVVAEAYAKCARDMEWSSCFKYKTLRYLDDLVTPLVAQNLSDVLRKNRTGPYLVALPAPSTLSSQETHWNDVIARAADPVPQVWDFIVSHLDTFLAHHGLVMSVSELEDVPDGPVDNPVLIEQPPQGRRIRGKLKRKELAVVFPLIILLSFFKVKLLLLPILFSVLLIKKMMLFILASAPNVIRLLSFCRPQFGPQFPQFGLQPAGILQEVTDNRGEFSSVYGLSSPYRDQPSYRTRPFNPDIIKDHQTLYGDVHERLSSHHNLQ